MNIFKNKNMRKNRKKKSTAHELVFASPLDKVLKAVYKKKGLKPTTKNPKDNDYCSTYLQRNKINARKKVFISEEVHNRVSNFLSTVENNKNTVDGFFDIVMLKHIEQYKDEMNELYKQQKVNLK